MKKTKIFILATALCAVLSVGNANAAPNSRHPGPNRPAHVVTVVQPHHHSGHHNVAHIRPQPHHHHHHHHHHGDVGNVILATAILVSAFM